MNKAKYLEQHIEEYDGLVVIVSGHGTERSILTSDYRVFSKLAIHRIFSNNHPKTREIPRLFIFDCCSGSGQQEIARATISKMQECEEKKQEEEKDERAKHIDLSKQISAGDCDRSWIRGDHNPDYRLAVIEAANPGFQAKARVDRGSYVIYSFCKKMMNILTANKRTFIHKIFDEIQEELHAQGKQHPTYIWNEDTKYIRFKTNKKGNKSLVSNMEYQKSEVDDSLEIKEDDALAIEMSRIQSNVE
eukprot:176051_1